MNVRTVRLLFVVFVAALTACSQPSQVLMPARTDIAQPHLQRARYIYFAGIQPIPPGQGGGFLGAGQLGVYAATANGNVAPLHVIVGKKTGLLEAGGCCVPQSAWFEPSNGSIWTCRTFSKFVSRFSTNAGDGSWGNVAPADRLTISPHTVSCGSVELTKKGDIVADDINKRFIATWRSGSIGTAAPIRKIVGPATGLLEPSQITFDDKGNYIVGDRCTPPQCSGKYRGQILIFAPNANGNVAPSRILSGRKTRLSSPNRVIYDPVHKLIYAANFATSTITAYPAESSGNVAPTIYIHGSRTHLWNPDAIALDKAGYLYVGNEPVVPGPPPASILVFAPGANGNVAPVQIIAGSNTKLAEVNGISVY